MVPKGPAIASGWLAIITDDCLRTFEYSMAADVVALNRPSLNAEWYNVFKASPERGPGNTMDWARKT